MKKVVNNRIITLFISVLLLSPAFSQEIAINTKTKENLPYVPTSSEQPQVNYIKDVNSKVLRNFYKAYGEKPDAKWYKTDNGFAVCFKNDQMNTNVYYKSNGMVEYKINYYFEEQMPAHIRHLIKSNFYDYTIFQVSEVHKDNSIGYYIKIEDKFKIKTVRVIGEEWEVTDELVKK